jgi:hypothetical protein
VKQVTRPLVAVIHATAASMPPVTDAFADSCGGATVWHLLDDRLVIEAERAGGLTAELRSRMTALIAYAVDGGADAVQLACSIYGPVAESGAQSVPVLTSDGAMFEEVVRLRPSVVTVLASLDASASDTAARLGDVLGKNDLVTRIDAVVVPGAKEAAALGDTEELGRLLATAAADAPSSDVVVLAQYSLAPGAIPAEEAIDVPILSAPRLAAEAIARSLEHQR